MPTTLRAAVIAAVEYGDQASAHHRVSVSLSTCRWGAGQYERDSDEGWLRKATY